MSLSYVSPRYRILVANFTGGRDIYGNPVKARYGFDQQLMLSGRSAPFSGRLTGGLVASTAIIEVVDNDFSTGHAVLTVGESEVISTIDYAIAGTLALTAANIAAAISNLQGFSATALGAVVTVTDLQGPFSNCLFLVVQYLGTIVNFTLTTNEGLFSGGSPAVGPVQEF